MAAARHHGPGANGRTAWEYSLSLSSCSGEAASPRRRKVCASPVCRTLYKRKKLSFVEGGVAGGGWESLLVMNAVGCCLGRCETSCELDGGRAGMGGNIDPTRTTGG